MLIFNTLIFSFVVNFQKEDRIVVGLKSCEQVEERFLRRISTLPMEESKLLFEI